MLKFRSNSFNALKSLNFINNNFRNLILYSTSTSTSLLAQSNKPIFANYLQNVLGFPTQQALSTSSKLALYRNNRGLKKVSEFKFVENADCVVQFLTKIGLQQSHIRNTVVAAPHILLCKVDRTLMPKKEAFLKLGFSVSDFADIVKSEHYIFFASFTTVIVPAIQALREIFGCDHISVIAILKKSNTMALYAVSKYLLPNVVLLRNYGIPIQSIRKFLVWVPSTIARKTGIFVDALIRVEEELGIPRDSPQFLRGIHLIASYNEKNVQIKREMFKSFGWTDSDVLLLSTKLPSCFSLSPATIKKKLGFLMNELSYQPKYIISDPSFLTYSLEKRIVPRHKVVLVLKERGLINTNLRLQSALKLSESQFLEKFVLPFKEVHELYSKVAGLTMDVLTERSLQSNSNPTSS